MAVMPLRPLQRHRPHPARVALAAAVCALQAGCAIVSPEPTWELVKATGGLAALAMAQAPTKASNTIYHLHAPFRKVCIEYNPRTQVPDIVPALQTELRNRGIESRVFDSEAAGRNCPVWLIYRAQFEWDIPPLSSQYRAYVSHATLSLRSTNGVVLSTSEYQQDSLLTMGKWASTRDKIGPVVAALVTGFED